MANHVTTGAKVIHDKSLLSTVDVETETSLVLGDLISCKVALTAHRPSRRQHIYAIKNLAAVNNFPSLGFMWPLTALTQAFANSDVPRCFIA